MIVKNFGESRFNDGGVEDEEDIEAMD